jgi:hypothetical protein
LNEEHRYISVARACMPRPVREIARFPCKRGRTGQNHIKQLARSKGREQVRTHRYDGLAEAIGVRVVGRGYYRIRINVEREYAGCSGPGCRKGENAGSRTYISHSFAVQIYARKEICEECARQEISRVKNCRPYSQTETGYSSHSSSVTFEDEVIR